VRRRGGYKSHVGEFVVNLLIQEYAFLAGERGLEALFNENAD
jgi:hypothetical protein